MVTSNSFGNESTLSLEVCTRVHFGNSPVVQPLKRTPNGTMVCDACAEYCVASPMSTVRVLAAPSTSSPQCPPTAHVCMCGSNGMAACLFDARLNQRGDAGMLAAIASTLEARFLEGLRDVTIASLHDPLHYSASVLSSLDQLDDDTFRHAHNKVLQCIDILRGVSSDPFRSTAVPIEERICLVVQTLDQFFMLDEYYIAVESIERVAMTLRGNSTERCLLLLALVRTYISSSDVDVRVVMSPHTRGTKPSWTLFYLQYRLPQDRGLPPQEAWRWASAQHAVGQASRTPPPTTNDKRRVFLGIRSSGVFEDATTNPDADGVLYCAATFRAKLLERNISFAQTSTFSDAKRRRVKEELKNLLLELKDDAGCKIRNLHRQLVTIDTKRSSTVEAIADYNAVLERGCVDNASPAPLRSYLGEPGDVVGFLKKWSTANSSDDFQLLLTHSTSRKACLLIRRCLQHWPPGGRQLLLLVLADIFGARGSHPDDIQILVDGDFISIIDIVSQPLTTAAKSYAESQSRVPETDVSIALLRLIETMFTASDDHLATVLRLGHTTTRILQAVVHDPSLSPTRVHAPYDVSVRGSSSALVTPHEAEFEYQLSITLQVIAESAAIASLAGDEAETEHAQRILKDLVHALMVALVKSIRNATHSYRESIFSLVDAADHVITPTLVAFVNREGMMMLLNMLQLAYSTCPLQELVKLVEVVSGLDTSVTRR